MSLLMDEKKKCSFNTETMGVLLHGSKQILQTFVEVQEKVANDPVLRFDPSELDLSRNQQILNQIEKTVRVQELFSLEHPTIVQWDPILFTQPLTLGVHRTMFTNTIIMLGTEEQVEKWVAPSLKYKIMGCYAQTELGHGSDVQNLETTAVFDKKTQEFVIHSPTISAYKFWPGDMGLFSNYALVFAKLIIDEESKGIQTFVVPIRDMKTNEPFPGIIVGDIGPKYGYQSKDNGYLGFSNYRVPKDSMLSKYHKITKEGKYFKPENEKIVYAGMLRTRVQFVIISSQLLAAPLTIAVRYSINRKQFKNENGQEIPVINYQLQQNKIVPRLAEAYAMNFSSKSLKQTFVRVLDECQKGNFSGLNMLHVNASGMKASYTWDAFYGTETLRQALGGHGFSMYSGIPAIFNMQSAFPTLEGENTVLMLQVARFLIKEYSHVVKGKKPQIDYLSEMDFFLDYKLSTQIASENFDLEVIRRLLTKNSCYQLKKVAQKMLHHVQTHGLSMKTVWNQKVGIELVQSALAHIHLVTFLNFLAQIQMVTNEGCRQVLLKLCQLYGLEKFLQNQSIAFEAGSISSAQLKTIKEAKEIVMKNLRPDLAGLVESFHFHDHTLKSALATTDGRMYENLLDWAQNKNYINKQENIDKLNNAFKPFVGNVAIPRL